MALCIIILIIGLTLVIISCEDNKSFESAPNQSALINKTDEVIKELNEEIVVIEMEYFGWLCSCAQWITTENKIKFEERTNKNESYGDSLFYYIVPSAD